MSEFGLWVFEFDNNSGLGVVQCDNRFRGEVIALLTLVSSFNKSPGSIQVLGVSGTIKSLKRKFLNSKLKLRPIERRELDATNT